MTGCTRCLAGYKGAWRTRKQIHVILHYHLPQTAEPPPAPLKTCPTYLPATVGRGRFPVIYVGPNTGPRGHVIQTRRQSQWLIGRPLVASALMRWSLLCRKLLPVATGQMRRYRARQTHPCGPSGMAGTFAAILQVIHAREWPTKIPRATGRKRL